MRTFILLLLMQLVSLPFSYARQPEHSTYLVAHDLKSLDYVRQIDYAQFDYIYLMAAPNWKEYDFSKSGEEIIRDLVTNHAFRKDQGVDVIRELIAQARACQTKVLLSFAGEGFRERVEDPALRAKFVDFMVAFIDKYDFDGIKLQFGTAYSYKSFKDLKDGAVEPLDAGTAKTNALSVSAKAGYATDTLSVMAATDVAFKFADKTRVDADVTLDVVYDFLTVNAYYGTDPVTGKEPSVDAEGNKEVDTYDKSTSEHMLSAQVITDLNSFEVPVKLTAGVNDIIAKQAISVKAEVTPMEDLKLTVKGGYTIDDNGRDDNGKIREQKNIIGKWSAGLDGEYTVNDYKITAGISAEQKVTEGAKVKLGMNAAVETTSLIPGATLKLAWADAKDLLDMDPDATNYGKITASIKMTF